MTTAQTLVGQDFGIYHIDKHVATVDVVDVYQAIDTLYERPVQIRVLRPELAEDRHFVQQFVSAGRSAMRLRHQNIVSVVDAGQIEGCAYIAVEALHTQSLAAYVARQDGPLPEATAHDVLRQIALGLQYAHREGFVHGRLNPKVIRITDKGRVLIADLELEHIWSNQSVTNQSIWRQIVNPHFLAPEQVNGDEKIGPEVDLFSLGTIAYWLVCGKLPFSGANALATMRQIVEATPAQPSTVVPSISSDLERTILHAIQKSAGERIGSAGEFLDGLAGKQVWEALAVEHKEGTPVRSSEVPEEFDSIPFAEEESAYPLPISIPVVSKAVTVANRYETNGAVPPKTKAPWYTDRSTAGVAVFVVGGALVLLVLVSLLQSASMLMERIVEGGDAGSQAAMVILPTVTSTPEPTVRNSQATTADALSSNEDLVDGNLEAGDVADRAPDEEDSEPEATDTPEKISTRAVRAARTDLGEAVVERRATVTAEQAESGRVDALPLAKVVTTPTRTPVPSNTPTGNPLGAATQPPTSSPTATPSATVTPSPTVTPRPIATSTSTTVPTVQPTSTTTGNPLGAVAGQAEAASAITDPAQMQDDVATVSDSGHSAGNVPVFSGRIAFTLWNPHSDRPDVYIWYADTGVRSVAIANRRQPDFGPGGILVANAEGGGYDNIVLMGRYGEDPWVISEHPEDAHPHWSADGKLVVFDSAHVGDRQHRIYLQTDLENRRELPPMMYDAWEIFGRYPIFLNDDRIAFHGCNYWDTGSICGIHVVDIHGGKPTTATGWPGDIPTDNLGGEIVFMSDRNGSWDVYRMRADGSSLRQLTESSTNDGLATVSPDGNYIAFLSDRDGEWAVYAMPSSGGDAHLLFTLDGQFGRGDYHWLQERLSWGP